MPDKIMIPMANYRFYLEIRELLSYNDGDSANPNLHWAREAGPFRRGQH